MYLIGFPLLVVPFAIYNMIAFLMPGMPWTAEVVSARLMSGQAWSVTPADILLAFAILLLSLEILKSARLGIRSIVDHALSLLLFMGMAAEFLLVGQAGTSTFFILLMVSLVDVIAGLIVAAPPVQRELEIERVEPTV